MKIENIRRIYVLGDLHLGVRNNSIEWFEIQRDFLLNFFISKLKEDGFDPDRDILVQVGDWHHIRESTNVRIANGSLEIMKKLSSLFKRGIFIILGNHDVYYKDRTDVHSLKGIDEIFDNVHIFEKPEILEINGKHDFLMLPWIENITALKEEALKYRELANYVFCHADIKGFQYNQFTKLEHGLEKDELSNYKKVYAGHIHIRQESKNLLYVGTPYEMDRGDRNNIKGFYVIEDLSKDHILDRFIQNTFSPKYVKYDIMEILNLNIEQITEKFKNNFVDISIENEFSKVFPPTKFIDLIKDSKYRSIDFFSYSKDQKKTKSELESSSSYEYNIFDILSEKLKEKNLSKDISDNVSLKFHEIYNSLKSNKNYE